MRAAPHHPVKSPVPLTALLYPAARSRAHKRRQTRVSLSGSDNKAGEGSAARENNGAEREKGGDMKSGQKRKDIPRDMNLNARSYMPEVGPVVSPIKECPNYSEPLETNEARMMLFAMLRVHLYHFVENHFEF
jgi:hypothetical protein